MGTRVSILKSVALTVLELLAFNDRGHAPFWENFFDHVRTVDGNMCVKFEVRRFNHFGAPFWENFWGHVRTVAGNMCVKFELRGCNRFGTISI